MWNYYFVGAVLFQLYKKTVIKFRVVSFFSVTEGVGQVFALVFPKPDQLYVSLWTKQCGALWTKWVVGFSTHTPCHIKRISLTVT